MKPSRETRVRSKGLEYIILNRKLKKESTGGLGDAEVPVLLFTLIEVNEVCWEKSN